MEDTDPELYREAFRSTDIPMLIADTNFAFRDINDAGLDFLGYDYDEIIGESVGLIAGDEEVYYEIIEHMLAGESWSGEFVVRRTDDRVVYGHGFATPIVVEGEVQGFLAFFLDTTKQQQYENVSEVLSRLLRHDLRNELNVIYGYTQQVASRIDDEEALAELQLVQDKVLDIVHKSERARDLRDLLERSHDRSNRPVRLDTVLQKRTVDATIDYPDAEFTFENFPEVEVVADDLLGEAIECLLENAVTHNDKETPVVDISVERANGSVYIRVADNGPGVPEAQRDLIFGREEYDQLHHGTGISLFFADNVISSYDGDLWVEDDDDEGAVFCIRLEEQATDE
ncbi:PAS domain S-box protein [Haloferax sp. MBLA0076]|uniref:histidine kinase n=1 Tax=Haloferax litoreum TaxID=2666140 RepID=A0A6A8GKS3_9EURY|nr:MULTISPECIES: PAS domain-containing sensor histidine kinase [Haloferax]KAB1194130.1 PAS domain S-box protein [Haloferax sp. CBA1148]MRX22687.1 PAS domain S-box protein [Haloferax litoreum]